MNVAQRTAGIMLPPPPMEFPVSMKTALRDGVADDGMRSKGEKNAFMQSYLGLFTGASFNATDGAQREFTKLVKQYGMQVPQLPLR